MAWSGLANLTPKSFICGWCDNKIATSEGYFDNVGHRIYICPFCDNPTIFRNEEQTPGCAYGQSVKNLPKDIDVIYEEIRSSHATGSWTSIVLLSRKLLMHIAVSKGAPQGKNFLDYVEYLCSQYVAPNNKSWVDQIRKIGNIANHELSIMGRGDAILLTDFSAMILKLIYEFSPPEPKP